MAKANYFGYGKKYNMEKDNPWVKNLRSLWLEYGFPSTTEAGSNFDCWKRVWA
jgi:hypothetical protein